MNRPATIAPLVDQAPRPLREYIARLEHAAGDDFRVDRLGGVHSSDPESSHRAALENFPRSGNQRRRVLEALAARAGHGATFEELVVDTGIESAAKRLTELVKGGWAIQTETTRKTHTGSKATVHLVSAKALRELEAERSPRTTAGGQASASIRDAETVRDQSLPSGEGAQPSAVHDEATPLFGDDGEQNGATNTQSPYDVFEDAA